MICHVKNYMLPPNLRFAPDRSTDKLPGREKEEGGLDCGRPGTWRGRRLDLDGLTEHEHSLKIFGKSFQA